MGRWYQARRFLKESPLAAASVLALLCLPIILLLAWMVTGRWQDERLVSAIQRQTVQMASQLTDAETDLEIAFSQVRGITTWVAEEGSARQAILQPSKVEQTNAFLHKITSSFGLDLIYILDAKGISVAASNAHTPTSTVGLNYSDREHYQTAIMGLPGRQFAVGRTTKVPGFFFSMPVRDKGKIIGTVGIKYDQPRLQHVIRTAGSIISDDYGIVVMAENPKYMFMAMPGATAERLPVRLRMSRYAREEFPVLPLSEGRVAGYPEIMRLEGAPVLVGSRSIIDLGLTVNVISDFDALTEILQQRRLAFMVGSAGATAMVWGLWVALLYFLRARGYRQRLEDVNSQLSQLNSELQEQATHDYLTGCLNRRAFTAMLMNEHERVRRYGGSLSLAILDIDYFKRINDARGHAVGDAALKFLVAQIEQRMRRNDALARLGGEEFALLMPNTTLAEALMVVDRMRQAISQEFVPEQVPPMQITFSAGLSSLKPGMSDRELLNAADKALYEAKGAGRNQVMAAP